MSERDRLVREEDAAWADLFRVVDGMARERLEEPGLRGGWSVKDLLWHLCCWTAESARQLERIRLGTYVEQDWDTDALNDRFFQESKRQDLATVRSSLVAARTRVLQEWAALAETTPEAIEWFEESGPVHIREHLADLEAFAERASS